MYYLRSGTAKSNWCEDRWSTYFHSDRDSATHTIESRGPNMFKCCGVSYELRDEYHEHVRPIHRRTPDLERNDDSAFGG